MRKYSIYAADGRFLGIFEFNEYQILEWVKSKKFRHFNAKWLFWRFHLNPAELNTDGTGRTAAADKAAKKVVEWIRLWFFESKSNAWEVFFKDISPLAKVNNRFYLEQVICQIGKIIETICNEEESNE